MSDTIEFKTRITINLAHERELTEAEFETMFGNLSEHIRGECSAAVSGFDAIAGSSITAEHCADRFGLSEPVYRPAFAVIKPAPQD